MRILLAVPMPPSARSTGAIPVLLHALLAALAPRHQVTVLTPVGPEPEEWQAVLDLRASGYEVCASRLMRQSPAQRWARRWRLLGTWLRGRCPWRAAWFYDPRLQQVLDRLLATQPFDLVQVEDNAMGAYQYRTRAPTILTEHEVRNRRPVDWRGWREGGWRAEGGKGLGDWLFREVDWQRWPGYETRVWQRFDRIQVFTPRDAQSVRAMSPAVGDRVRVNPFGVEIPEALDPHCEESGRLVFVGNYTHAPNVDAALWLGREIMPRLRERCPGVRLDLLGIYPPAPVRALAGPDITVTGPVPDITPYFERASLVLAPVRVGGGMRMKVLQAMAMGRSVVTTSRGVEGLQVNGTPPPLVLAEDTNEITRAVVDLLSASDERHLLGQRARQFVVEHYSPAAYGRRLESIYGELIPARVEIEVRG